MTTLFRCLSSSARTLRLRSVWGNSGNLVTIVFLVFSAWLNLGCSNRREVKVVAKNFNEEVSNLQNLVFTFNHNLWPENALNEWDSTQYISFEPALSGKFRWTAPNELVFSPSVPLGAATAYKARLSDALLNHANRDLNLKISRETIDFHTPFLRLESVRSWWEISSESGRPEPQVQVVFNYPVDIPGMKERLSILENDSEIGYRLLPSGSPDVLAISLSSGAGVEQERTLKMIFKEGVKIENETHATIKPIEKEFIVPSPITLKVTEVTSGFYNNKGRIFVSTSQNLVPEQIAGSLKLHPQLPFIVTREEGGFSVRADFLESETYVLTIGKSLKGVLGQTLGEEVSQDFFFGKMPESIQFLTSRAQYLSAKGNRNIGVRITNIPSVHVRISKVYDNNLLHYLANGRYENYSEVGDSWAPDGTFSYSEDYRRQYSDVLVSKKIQTADLPGQGAEKALNLALPEAYGKVRKGVYLVSVASSDAMYLSAHKLVSVSDIGLIVKQGKDGVWVFANSIHEAKPLKNVEITLISSNNQTMHTMKTGADGVAHVSGLAEKAPGFRLAMVTAALDEDFNYLSMNDAQVETSRFEVEGVRGNATGVQAFIYGERDVYRPGETLHFVSVLRSDEWKTLSEFPVKLRLVTPNGQAYGSWLKETDAQGAVELSAKVGEASLTGRYTLELYNVNDVLLGSTHVNVEEFIPDRIKVELVGGKSQYVSGEKVSLNAVATNLFGPPASNRSYEMEFQLGRKQFYAAEHPGFSFEIPAEVKFERLRKQGTTDTEGKAETEFAVSEDYKDIGMLEGKIYVTIFDENGRAVNRLHTFEVATQPVLYGIGLPDRYVGVNTPVPIQVLAVDPSGKIRRGERSKVEVIRVTYQTVIEKKNERMQYASKRKDEIVYEQTLNLAEGRGLFRYTPTVSGEYEVRVRRPGADRYTVLTFYAYGYGFTQYSSFEVSSEGRVLIETDKEKYRPGEKAKILFKTPFDGQLLVTIEQGEVKHYQIVRTKNKAAEVPLTVSKEYLPNVYIAATLMRPMNADQIPLTVAHGFEPMRVEAPDRVMEVKINAHSAVRSKTRQRIRVRTKPHSELTIGVVDEGILQIRNFVTPDIYGHFYQKRALEVQSADLYAWLFPEMDFGKTSSPGGDGFNLERRINPLGNGNRDLVRFWSGLLKANAKGEVEYEVDIPQFSGSLRVMAVAFNDHSFGSTSHQMKVSDPLVISTGIPRFTSPGDEIIVPLTLTNSATENTNAVVSVTVKGPVVIPDFKEQTVKLPKGGEEQMKINLKALEATGNAKVTVKARAFGETFVQEYSFNVRPASPLLKVAASGSISGGETKELNLNRGFMPETSEAQLILSRSPMVEGGGKALSTLLGYPHGCLEQTISKAFPQLYFAELSKSMMVPVSRGGLGASDLNPAFNVQQAVRRTESQQLFNGGFAMWPGSVRDDWWVSAYALQFLDEARRAGFEVNPNTYHSAITYLSDKSGRKETEPLAGRLSDGGTTAHSVAPAEAIYSLYVLAAVGNPNRPMMNYYKQHQELLTNETRYLLAGAYHYIGDPASYRALLPTSYGADDRNYSRGYLSPLSGLGLVLNMLIDTDPQNLQIPVLARQLSQSIASKNTLNTQEAVFGVLALGKIARNTQSSSATALVISGDRQLGRFDGEKELTLTEHLTDNPVKIKVEGEGKLYWFSEVSGVDAGGIYTEEDDGLRVRRVYLDRNGKPINNFSQNDLVVVKITLSSTRNIDVPNVVVTDLLPAGFEVENPRLTSSRDMPWIKEVSVPDYFDIRHDRIHYFVTATPVEKTFYYQARVTSAGIFTVGPVAADAMYQTHLKSYSGGRKIHVR